MNKIEIIKGLTEAGFTVKEDTIEKNGIKKDIIIIMTNNNINPTIYPDQFEKVDDIDEIIEFVKLSILNSLTDNDIKELLSDREYILNNVTIGLAEKGRTSGKYITFDSEIKGYENYLMVSLTIGKNNGSVTLSENIIKMSGLSLEELKEKAMVNTIKNAVAFNMESLIPCAPSGSGMVVLTNKSQFKGAASIYAKELIKEYFPDAEEIVCIPSSIHEWILMDKANVSDIDFVTEMISEVNSTQVAPEEILGTKPVVLSL